MPNQPGSTEAPMLPSYDPARNDIWQMSNKWEDYETNWDDMTDLIISMMCRQSDPMAANFTDKWARIDAAEVYHLKGGRSNAVWKQVVDAAENLLGAGMRFRDDKNRRAHFVAVIDEVMVQDTTIYARFKGGLMKELVLHHRKNYSNVRLKALATLRGQARALYKLLIRFSDTKYRTIDYKELCDKIGISYETYLPFSRFENKILKRCNDRFKKNPHCAFTITWTYKGRGSSISNITFALKPKAFLDDNIEAPSDEEVNQVKAEIEKARNGAVATPVEMHPEQWLAYIKDNRPDEYRNRYNSERVVAAACLFDSSETEIHAKTQARMMQSYAEETKRQRRRGGVLA